ncbi:uncharacterized protein LOC106459325 [Limulus polyphemus]|uniref:Uncharacterized protein LOC106459325 n=1 Tax=Limulus polyphemus TaxID=6850 RepID=A0ABM1B432_LIMPO|nr:uncharacterized protein LOC106459325 [Limulus polyphemus]XP_022241495.1 uncharacterized protein LOC106459325 [Limulus polyphemus]XP_022241496.1 uncharacterized protein LOC106459325 [Limulus polyphemus]XP_022241497.1 uncharacterized protein LOC106459325 [Limulus polyphemus]XP_022241498.1 uncharacterized protein LOC106459325 [Limulus polyphemus]
MVRQMYETAFDCRVKRNVEDIDRLANSSVFHMESMHLEHGSYQESESSTSSNSGSSGTTPTRYPRSLPQKYLHGRIRQSLSQCEQPEKRKLFHLRSKASPKPFSKQECEKNPTNGGRRRQEQDRKNMSGGLLPFICKKAIRGHLGVRVLPMELGKPLSNLQEKNSPGIEDLERKISNCDLETSDHFKVVRLQINDDLKSSASLVKDSSRNSDSSVRKELAYSNIAKFQCEEKYTRPPGDYESPLNQCEEKDTRPPGDYEPPWDQCEEKFKMPPDDYESPLNQCEEKDTRPPDDYEPPWDQCEENDTRPPDDYESPWDQCKENDTRPPDDYELPWDALSPCSSLDEILSAHYLSSSANVPSFQSCHSFFMGGRKDPSDPSVELRHSCCNESSFSKSITDVNQQSDISNTRSLVDYCLPWDLRKHVDQPQPFASLSHSDKTGEQDPIIPIDSSDFNSPSLSDLRNFHQCKASQSHSDKAYSPNEKKIGFSKSTLSVKKNINLPSTLSSESYLQTELVPSTNRDIENIPGVPKRPISLPIQNVVAASSVMSTTREQSNIVRKQLISQSSVNGPNAAFVSVSSSMIPVTREQSVKVSKQFVSQISVSDSDAVHSSSSKVYGPSPRLHLNLDLNTVNVPKHVRKQVLLHPGFSEMGPSVEEVDPSVPLEKQGWYHGSIRRIDAEKLLRVLKEGSYLVRNSESSKQDFSLSLKSARGFMHMKIVCNDGKFILGQFSKPFDSIPEIISYYSLHKLPIKGAEYMSLRHPVIDQLL